MLRGYIHPLEELTQLQREMNRLFGDYRNGTESYPPVNLSVNGETAFVTAELPGVAPEEISISVANETLSIDGERKEEPVAEKTVFHRAERGFGKFSKTLRLPFEIDAEKVHAKYMNGLLKITLPRAEKSKPRKIEIMK